MCDHYSICMSLQQEWLKSTKPKVWETEGPVWLQRSGRHLRLLGVNQLPRKQLRQGIFFMCAQSSMNKSEWLNEWFDQNRNAADFQAVTLLCKCGVKRITIKIARKKMTFILQNTEAMLQLRISKQLIFYTSCYKMNRREEVYLEERERLENELPA